MEATDDGAPDAGDGAGEPLTIGITATARRLAIGLGAAAASVIVALPFVFFAVTPQAGPVRLLATAMLGVLAALAVVPIAVGVRFFVTQRLHIDAAGVGYAHSGRDIARAPFEQICSDGRRLLIDGHAVVLRHVGAVFEPEAVQTQLLSRLSAEQRLSAGQFELRLARGLLRRQRGTLLALLVGVALLAAVLNAPRQLWRSIGKWIAAQAGL